MKKERNNQSPQNKSNNADINKDEHRVGRADQDDIYDISHMDRQEGTMNHGALGGNFESYRDEEEESSKRGDDSNK